MFDLPPAIEKLLASLGVNTLRLKWKLRYLEQDWNRRRAARERARSGEIQRYKACNRCGHLALADDKVCKCGRRLPSYATYRVMRALALNAPGATTVSLGFVGLILILFAALVAADGWRALMAPSLDALLAFGAFAEALAADGQLWRILTMALAHAGIWHIGFNAIAISQVMPRFEVDIGPWRTLLVITLTQIGTVIGHVVWYRNPWIPTVGASGVAFGLIGFGLAYAHRLGRADERNFYFRWFLYGAIFGIAIGANNAGHAGGFLAGLPLGFWMGGREPRGLAKKAINAAGMICLLLWVASVVCLGLSVAGWIGEQ